MASILKDARRAVRQLRRTPGFALAVIATLAVGFGSVAAIFAIVNAVLIRPLPFPESDRLVALHHTAPGWNVATTGMSEGTYDYYRRHARAFEEIGLYNEHAVNLIDGDDTERVPVALVTPSVFRMLRVHPIVGSIFHEEALRGRKIGAVLISHDLWTRRYGSDPHIVGRLIRANNLSLEVIGVLPAGFDFPKRETGIWYADTHDESPHPSVRDLHLSGIGRLEPGVTPEQAQSELSGLLRAMIGAYPDATPDILQTGRLDPRVIALKGEVMGAIKVPLLVLLCATGLVLAISWANVANLWLVRGEARRHDVAVQRALGATTIDLLRATVCESFLLVVPAAVFGLLLARAGVTAIIGSRAAELFPRAHEIQLDGVAIGLVALLAIVTGVTLAALSLAQTVRRDLTAAFRSGARQQTMGRTQRAAQRGLVALQVALALVVLIGSAAMVQSLWRMRHVPLGFAPEDRLTFSLSLPYNPSYNSDVAFYERLVQELRALPGVSAVATAGIVPLRPEPLDVDDPLMLVPAAPGEAPAVRANINLVTPGYFDVMAIPIVAGRAFDPAAQWRDEQPVIISESLAKSLAPGESLIGRRLYGRRPDRYAPYRVIGVARDVVGASIAGGPARTLYVPVLPMAADATAKPLYGPGISTIVMRTSTPAATLVPPIRQIVHTLNPRVAIANIRTLQDIVNASMARTTLIAALLTIGASAGLLLALIGVCGVTMHLVATRRKEMAVRFALGARPMEVRGLVLRSVVTTLLAGVAIGVGGGLVLTRALGALLFGVAAWDPLTLVVCPAIVLLVGLLAGDVPARRASRIDPARALASD